MTTTKEPTELIAMPDMNLPTPTKVKEDLQAAFGSIFKKLEDEVAGFKPNLKTTTGRQDIASMAYKISRTKTGLDAAAQKLTADQKAIIDAVNGERKSMKERLDEMRDDVRKPLTEWEEKEKTRISLVEISFEIITTNTHDDVEMIDMTIDQVRAYASHLESIVPCDEETFLDQAEEFNELVAGKVEKLKTRIERMIEREAEQNELAELRQMKADKEAQEAKDKAETDAQDAIEAEKETARLALARAAKAEEDSEYAAQQANADKKAAIEQAEKDRLTAIEEAEADRKALVKKAEEEKQAAVEDERQKVARAKALEEEAEAERAADIEHRKKINVAALEAILKASEIDRDQGKMIIQAISKGQIPHVKISY